MNLYIKEWPNKTATIMLDTGQILFTFSSVESARIACRDWHSACREDRDNKDKGSNSCQVLTG